MVVAVDLIYLVKTGAGGHIHLTADDGLDARLFCSLIKLHAAVHHAVVGAGNGGLSALLTRSISWSMRQAPSSRLYSVWMCRWTKGPGICAVMLRSCFCLLFQALPQISANASSFFIRCERPDLLTGGSKQPHSAGERKIRVLHPLGSGFLQHLRQSFQGILLFQKADGLQGLRIGTGRFAKVCRIAVGLSVGLVAHLFERLCACISSAAFPAPIKLSSRSTLAPVLT